MVAAVVFFVVLGARLVGSLEPLELDAYDRFLRLQPAAAIDDVPVVLVRIYEEDIREFGHPLCDDLLARALAHLLAAEPRAIGVDLYRDVPVPSCAGPKQAGGPRLQDVVGGAGRIVMIAKFGEIPAPQWLEASQVGFSGVPVDPGGTVRRGLLFQWEGETPHLSFSLQLALRYLRAEGIALEADATDPNYVRLGPTTIPPFGRNDGGYVRADDAGYQFLLDYRLGPNAFPTLSLREVFAATRLRDSLHDKVVILGTTAPSVKDSFYAPHGQRMYGVEAHAHAVTQLVRWARGQDRPLSTLAEPAEAFWILAWSVLGAFLALWNRSLWLTVLAASGGVAALLASGYALFALAWWIPVAPPLLAGVGSTGLVALYVAVVERRERRQVTRLFSRFIGSRVAEEIWEQRDEFMAPGQTGRPESRWGVLTVLMLDLEGYTGISEKLDPRVLIEWVSEFTSAMADVVERHGGVVDDYAGDGIKANFGFPVPRSRPEEIDADAADAVLCALAMGVEMIRLNKRWRERELPQGRLRVGVFTGPAVVGVIGSGQNLKYTSVGDTVNLAARLESFDKDGFSSDPDEGDWRVLVGEDTMRRVESGFEAVALGLHALKGKAEKVAIYRVLGVRRPERPPAGGSRSPAGSSHA